MASEALLLWTSMTQPRLSSLGYCLLRALISRSFVPLSSPRLTLDSELYTLGLTMFCLNLITVMHDECMQCRGAYPEVEACPWARSLS